MKRPLLLALGALLGLGSLGGAAFLLATKRVVVEGRSMLPAYAPGDRLLVNRLAYVRTRPKLGDVVLVRRPLAEPQMHVKRVAAGPGEEVESAGEKRKLGPDEWWLLGDNPEESTDSRQLGPVRANEIEGKVMFKY